MNVFIGNILKLNGLEKGLLIILVILIVVGLFFIFRDVAIEFVKLYKNKNNNNNDNY